MTAPATGPRALGLDLSLTSTGVASSLGWCTRIRPRTRGLDRLREIVTSVRGHAKGYPLAVIEGPAYSRASQAGHDELAALRWMVRDALDRARIPIAIVAPTTLKLWATGKGNASKGDMKSAMATRFPASGLTSSDEADALALADMGAAWLTNQEILTDHERRGLRGVDWPEQEVTLR
jgi:crossover junction endodeoxyribonuclease RuvC